VAAWAAVAARAVLVRLGAAAATAIAVLEAVTRIVRLLTAAAMAHTGTQPVGTGDTQITDLTTTALGLATRAWLPRAAS